jgi:hypothetical protein
VQAVLRQHHQLAGVEFVTFGDLGVGRLLVLADTDLAELPLPSSRTIEADRSD